MSDTMLIGSRREISNPEIRIRFTEWKWMDDKGDAHLELSHPLVSITDSYGEVMDRLTGAVKAAIKYLEEHQ